MRHVSNGCSESRVLVISHFTWNKPHSLHVLHNFFFVNSHRTVQSNHLCVSVASAYSTILHVWNTCEEVRSAQQKFQITALCFFSQHLNRFTSLRILPTLKSKRDCARENAPKGKQQIKAWNSTVGKMCCCRVIFQSLGRGDDANPVRSTLRLIHFPHVPHRWASMSLCMWRYFCHAQNYAGIVCHLSR